MKKMDQLPLNAQKYIKRIEELLHIPVILVSIGAEREENIVLKNVF